MGKDWTALHDFLLIQATQTHGDRWQFISTVVPGRSPAECAERHKELDAKGLGTLETLQAHQASLRSAKPLNPRKEFVPKPSPFPALIEQAKVDKTARKWAQRAASKKTRASVATTSAKRVLLKENVAAVPLQTTAPRPNPRVPLGEMDSGPFTIPDDDPVVLEIEGRSGLLSPKTPQAPTHSAHPISAADFFMSDCVFSPPKRTPSGLLRDATSLLPHRPHQVRLSMNAYGISPGIRNYATSTNPTLSNNTNSNNNSTAKISFLNELFDEEEDIMAGSPLAKQDSIPVTPIYVKQEQLGSSGARIVAPSAGSRSAYHRPDRAPPRTPVFHPPLGPNPLLSVAPSYHHSLPYSAPPTQQPMTQTATSSRHHFPGHNNAKPPSSRRANPSNDMAVELEMEKRHEYSVIKIPRREVDDLFEENVQTMPEEERRIVLPPVSTENLRWVTTKADKISMDQVALIRQQMKDYFQITVQAYSIQKELSGQEDKKTIYWQNELEQLQSNAEWGIQQVGGQSAFNIPGLDQIPDVIALQPHPTASKTIAFKKKLRAAVRAGVKSRNLSPKSKAKKKNWKTELFAPLPHSVVCSLALLDHVFDRNLQPAIMSVVKSHLVDFSTLETKLFYMGVLQHGFNDWSTIRALYLPTRTVMQLKHRCNNVKYRKSHAGMDCIKHLWLQPFKPLTVSERELIVAGCRKFGKKFKFMARKIFSTYPLTMLKQTWDELYSLGEIEEKWLAHRNDLGHVMENPPPYKTEAQPTMHYSPALMMRPMSSSYLPPSYMLPNHAHSLRPYDPSFPPPSPFLPIQSCHPPQKIQPPAGLQQDPLQTDQFYADLFTDTGSVYQPSEWDLPTVKVPPPPSITTEPEVNYEDFLKTIFEVEEEDSPRQPSHLQNQVQEELEESEMIPKVSLMGAYDCNSSDNDEKAFKSPEKKKSPGKKTSPAKFVSPRKRTSPTKRSPVKRASFEVNPIDSFFNFYNDESLLSSLLSPERRVTRSCSRVTTADNSVQRPRTITSTGSPKLHGVGRKGFKKPRVETGSSSSGSRDKKRKSNDLILSSPRRSKRRMQLFVDGNQSSFSHSKRKALNPTHVEGSYELIVCHRSTGAINSAASATDENSTSKQALA